MTETGGWTNVRRQCSVDTSEMAQDTAARLEASVAALLSTEQRGGSGALDARLLIFEIDDGNGCRRMSFSEARPPAEIVPVLEILRPFCRPIINIRS